MAELVALAKAQPGNLKIGSAGNGSGTHLMAELLMRGAGVNMTHVPYKGAGPAVTATVGGVPCGKEISTMLITIIAFR